MLHTLRQFVWPTLISPGLYAPKLSLTAHDGRWVRSVDYLNQFICLLFFRECNEQTGQWLQEYESINVLDDSHVFAITASKPEALRQFSAEHELSIMLLYDPLAIDARRYGASGRRFYCKDAVVCIGNTGMIEAAILGKAPLTELNQARADYLRATTIAQTNDELDDDYRDTIGALATNAVQMISSEAAVTLLQQNTSFQVVDVRTLSEYEPDHIPGSLHIPVDELHQRHTELMGQPGLVFICQAGGRAFSAAEFMASIGQNDLYVVEGGMSSWTGTRKTDGVIQH